MMPVKLPLLKQRPQAPQFLNHSDIIFEQIAFSRAGFAQYLTARISDKCLLLAS